MTAAITTPSRRPARRTPEDRAGADGPPGGNKGTGTPWLSPVPDCEPPFDDELTGPYRVRGLADRRAGTGATQRRATEATRPHPTSDPVPPGPPSAVPGQVEAARPTNRSAVPATRAAGAAGGSGTGGGTGAGHVRPSVVSSGRVPGWSREYDVGVELTSSTVLPRADRAGWMLAQALLEVLAGTRALAQLREHCAPDVFAGMEDQRMLRGPKPPRLITVRVDEPADGVGEVAAVFRHADRVRVMAFRLRGIDGRWRITHLQIG
jgi:hypothetical protein